MVGDHRSVVGKPACLHWSGKSYSAGPGGAAVDGGSEAHVQLASAGGAFGGRIVVVNDGAMRVGAGSRGVDADAGKEMIHWARSGVDGDPSDGTPSFAVGGTAHNDVVGSAARAEAAIRPHDENFAGAVDARRWQVGIAPTSASQVTVDAGDGLTLASALAAVGGSGEADVAAALSNAARPASYVERGHDRVPPGEHIGLAFGFVVAVGVGEIVDPDPCQRGLGRSGERERHEGKKG